MTVARWRKKRSVGAAAAKAADEASQLKKTVLRKSLQQERDRASKLERNLAIARRDVETQTALALKAGKEAAQLKQVVEKGSAEQRQSLQQEHDKAEALAQELSTARSKIYAYEAQARQASNQAAELKQGAESGTADLRKSLEQERDRATSWSRTSRPRGAMSRRKPRWRSRRARKPRS